MLEMFQRAQQEVALVPRGVLEVAGTALQVRGAVALAREERRTITVLAGCLVAGGQPAQVTHRDPSGAQWTITVGAAAMSPAPLGIAAAAPRG